MSDVSIGAELVSLQGVALRKSKSRVIARLFAFRDACAAGPRERPMERLAAVGLIAAASGCAQALHDGLVWSCRFCLVTVASPSQIRMNQRGRKWSERLSVDSSLSAVVCFLLPGGPNFRSIRSELNEIRPARSV